MIKKVRASAFEYRRQKNTDKLLITNVNTFPTEILCCKPDLFIQLNHNLEFCLELN